MSSKSVKPVQTPESSPQNDSPPRTESRETRRARRLAAFIEKFTGKTNKTDRSPAPVVQPPPADEEAPVLEDLLLDAPDAWMVVHCEDGAIAEISQRFIEWTGLDRDQLIGSRLVNLVSPTERKAAQAICEFAGVGGVHVLELPCATEGIRPKLVEFTSRRARPGNGRYSVLIARDVGERAATERYLRAERDRLNMFIRSMRDSLILFSPTGDILYSNPAAEQMFEPYELPSICHRWLTEFSHEDSSDLQGLTSAYEGKTLELESGDGRVFLVTRSFLFEYGKRATVMLMAKDITEQKLIENKSHQLEIELIRESKLAEFGTLSAGIAHNLNGPLTGILGLCDLLSLDHPDMKQIQQIRNQAIQMRDIIINLLQKARNEQECEPQDLKIEDIVTTELRLLDANLFFKHQVEKEIDFQEDTPTIHGVYIHVSQAVGNLLRNAIDAMYQSEVRKLTVRTRADDRFLCLSVTDTGCGISGEIRKKLFKPFFTTKPKAGQAKAGEPTGTGLGLSTSRGVLSRYGADITVESEPGSGSTFTIRFPLHRKPPEENAEAG